MHRSVLMATLAGLVAGAACSFYAPALDDCTLRCSPEGLCPSGSKCMGGACTSGSRACECVVGDLRACGKAVGECRPGQQQCREGGTWAECLGEVAPVAEVCDGKDNDCDGLMDLGPMVTVADDVFSAWRWLGLDDGYSLTYGRHATDGGPGFEYLTRQFDRELAPRRDVHLFDVPTLQRVVAATRGDVTYVAWPPTDGLDAGAVRFLSIDGAGTLRDLGEYTQADYSSLLNLAAPRDGGDLVANWLTATTPRHSRLARWSVDGGLSRVFDVDDGMDGGEGFGPPEFVRMSQGGRYAGFTNYLYLPDGGIDLVHRFLVDTLDRRVVRDDAPYLASDTTVIWEFGATPVVTYPYIDTDKVDGMSGIYLNVDVRTKNSEDDLIFDEDLNPGEHWDDPGSAIDADGNLVVAYQDLVEHQLVLGRATGLGTTSGVKLFRRALTPAEGFGNPRLAQSGAAAMMGLTWWHEERLDARRVCGPLTAP